MIIKHRKITLAIMCYGLFGTEYHRTPEEMDGLMDYVSACARYAEKLHKFKLLSGVVFCGGVTNPNHHPGKSEAETTARYFVRQLEVVGKISAHEIDQINFRFEKYSFNTPQNIFFTLQLMQGRFAPLMEEEREIYERGDHHEIRQAQRQNEQWQSLSHNIIFICDHYRNRKVGTMLSILRHSHVLDDSFQLSVKSFKRKDIHPNSSYLKQWGAAWYYWFNHHKFFEDLKVNQ